MIKLNTYETFDGELLFSYMEIDVTVSMDDDAPQVWIGDFDITHLVSDADLERFTENWVSGKNQWDADEHAALGDWQYEQAKDRALDKVDT